MNETTQDPKTITAVTAVVPIPWIAWSLSQPSLELPMNDEKHLVINVSRLIFHGKLHFFFTITVQSDFMLT